MKKVFNGNITHFFLIGFRDETEYGLVVNIQSLVPDSISIPNPQGWLLMRTMGLIHVGSAMVLEFFSKPE